MTPQTSTGGNPGPDLVTPMDGPDHKEKPTAWGGRDSHGWTPAMVRADAERRHKEDIVLFTALFTLILIVALLWRKAN